MESPAQRLVTQYQNSRAQTPKGEFLQQLVTMLSNRNFNDATQLLHRYDTNRFVITQEETAVINAAVEIAKKKLNEKLEDQGYVSTVGDRRDREDEIRYFNEDLAKFLNTFAQYQRGESLGLYNAPSPFRYFNFDSST